MKAKINFMASEAIDHENILKFLGAVVNDSDGTYLHFAHQQDLKFFEEDICQIKKKYERNQTPFVVICKTDLYLYKH